MVPAVSLHVARPADQQAAELIKYTVTKIAVTEIVPYNGFSPRLPEAETVIVMNRVAAGTLGETELADLFRGAGVPTEA